MNGYGYGLIKLYVYTPKFEFYIIFACHETVFFSQPYKNKKWVRFDLQAVCRQPTAALEYKIPY